MTRLNLFTVFHLNLMYSSIEEEERPEVLEKCYWPLLRLARKHNLPFGIEATGYTLKAIANVDPEWIEELRALVTEGICEFVGSGYSQIIGPLVPGEVNRANLRIGNDVYEELLGLLPRIALVNEQAYSAGLIRHYLDAEYQAVVMEWDNPFRFHPDWDPEWRYLPQVASGQHGEEISLLWNKSIAFQKFQRYGHGDMELDEYIQYLASHTSDSPRAMSLYGNDVEVFDFRPGRYHTEAKLDGETEWVRIEELFDKLKRDGRFNLIFPSGVLEMLSESNAGNRLSLESPEQPIPVKKQGKYNITRWAVTGRDDLGINTTCLRIYANLKDDPEASEEDWKELCYLWSSDFRTHITEKRWGNYLKRLQVFSDKWEKRPSEKTSTGSQSNKVRVGPPLIREEGRFLHIDTDSLSITLNRSRGLTLNKLHFKDAGPIPQVVTLPHGYFDDISMGADWYTGHLVHEGSGQPKVTDLNSTDPEVEKSDNEISITGTVPTLLGPVQKTITVSLNEPSVALKYCLKWEAVPIGALRLGHITLNPEAFDRKSLYFKAHNGGFEAETFLLNGRRVEHGAPVSFLVSAEGGMGMVEGWLDIGDGRNHLRLESNRSELAVIGLVTYREIGEKYFCRISFSAGELDETRRGQDMLPGDLSFGFRISSS